MAATMVLRRLVGNSRAALLRRRAAASFFTSSSPVAGCRWIRGNPIILQGRRRYGTPQSEPETTKAVEQLGTLELLKYPIKVVVQRYREPLSTRERFILKAWAPYFVVVIGTICGVEYHARKYEPHFRINNRSKKEE